eukprot:UN14747
MWLVKVETENRLVFQSGQIELLKEVYKVQRRVAVVLINGGPIALDWLKNINVPVLEAYYPDWFGSQVIAETLFGT